MSEQQQIKPNTNEQDSDTIDELGEVALGGAKTTIDDGDLDKLLDEIDDVLETNAEEFVARFVQKGGQ